jgi:FkbM family methyltransferase
VTTGLLKRATHRVVFARRERRLVLDHFRPLLPAGALAFDVGANRGEVAQLLVHLGGRVVAVEPNPELADGLRRRFGDRVAVECAAVGAAEGTAELRLGKDDAHSTLSPDWVERAPTQDRWGETIEVPVTTLDALAARHGAPQLVKIDVEGFEDAVLAGLSTAPPVVVFEFQCAALEVAARAVRRLEALGGYRFNATALEERRFLLPETVDGDVVLAVLAELRARDGAAYGDVYASNG